jgi:hypothetical protein
MSFVLTAGSFAAIEKDFCHAFREGLEYRKDLLREQHLILVPSAGLRKHLLRLLFESGSGLTEEIRIYIYRGSSAPAHTENSFHRYVQSRWCENSCGGRMARKSED